MQLEQTQKTHTIEEEYCFETHVYMPERKDSSVCHLTSVLLYKAKTRTVL